MTTLKTEYSISLYRLQNGVTTLISQDKDSIRFSMKTSKNDADTYFGKETEILERTINGKKAKVKWDWKKFKSTKGFPVDDNLISWVIGQERALQECFLCLDEWAHKLKTLEGQKWYDDWKDPDTPKPSVKSKLSPGPYLLLLGDPGTGKSLIGRALSEKLTEIYKENGIKLFDVLSWKNPVLPSQPRVSIHTVGEGKKVLQREERKEFKHWSATKLRPNPGQIRERA